jgi:hypothetical protein
MEERPFQNTPVKVLKVVTLPLGLARSGLVTHAGEFLTTGTTHKNKPDRFFPKQDTDIKVFID